MDAIVEIIDGVAYILGEGGCRSGGKCVFDRDKCLCKCMKYEFAYHYRKMTEDDSKMVHEAIEKGVMKHE